MKNLFKIGTSLVLAVIAALVVFLAALIGGARIGTVFLRSFVAFLTAGVLAWLVLFLLEAKGIAAFDRELTPQDIRGLGYDREGAERICALLSRRVQVEEYLALAEEREPCIYHVACVADKSRIDVSAVSCDADNLAVCRSLQGVSVDVAVARSRERCTVNGTD